MNKYLTHTEDNFGAKTVKIYNTVKLFSISIWNRLDSRVVYFDTLEDLQCDYDFHFRYGHTVSSKEEFDTEYINYTQNLNKIAKEL